MSLSHTQLKARFKKLTEKQLIHTFNQLHDAIAKLDQPVEEGQDEMTPAFKESNRKYYRKQLDIINKIREDRAATQRCGNCLNYGDPDKCPRSHQVNDKVNTPDENSAVCEENKYEDMRPDKLDKSNPRGTRKKREAEAAAAKKAAHQKRRREKKKLLDEKREAEAKAKEVEKEINEGIEAMEQESK